MKELILLANNQPLVFIGLLSNIQTVVLNISDFCEKGVGE